MIRVNDFDGYIFDMDGLLLDTEPTYFVAWQQAINQMGFEIDYTNIQSLSGLHIHHVEQELSLWLGNHFDLALFHNLAKDAWHKHIEQAGINVKDGVIDLLDLLSQHKLAVSVASNSPRSYIEKCLGLSGLNTYFSTIVGCDDVSHVKPAPDIFLKAAELMQIDITRCVVFEDSNIGITAAAASGAYPVFVPSSLPPHPATLSVSQCLLKNLSQLCLELG